MTRFSSRSACGIWSTTLSSPKSPKVTTAGPCRLQLNLNLRRRMKHTLHPPQSTIENIETTVSRLFYETGEELSMNGQTYRVIREGDRFMLYGPKPSIGTFFSCDGTQ